MLHTDTTSTLYGVVGQRGFARHTRLSGNNHIFVPEPAS